MLNINIAITYRYLKLFLSQVSHLINSKFANNSDRQQIP